MQYIKIGQIVNTHGHKGEIKVYPLTDDPYRFLELRHAYIKTGPEYVRYQVCQARLHQNMAILELNEIPDMNAAIRLKGSYLELPQDELKPLPPGQYYIFQIVGLEVAAGEQVLGRIVEVTKTGANDVYVVETPEKKLLYLPAIKDVVKEINLSEGRMNIEVIPGLLD